MCTLAYYNNILYLKLTVLELSRYLTNLQLEFEIYVIIYIIINLKLKVAD